MSEVKIISQNKERNMEMACIDGRTHHRAIDPKKPTFPKKKGVRPEKEKK